jgi:hypothetical protein
LAVLTSVDARAAGADPYAKPNTFDPFGRPHVYGPWWLELHRFGLSSADRAWIGTSLLISSLVVMVYLCRPVNLLHTIATVILVASPPMMLAFERGNNDLVIFLMLALAGYLSGTYAIWRTVLSAIIVWFAAALKIYPLAAASFLLCRGGRVCGGITLAGVGIGFLLIRIYYDYDFTSAMSAMPRPDSSTAYGFRVIHLIWMTPAMLKGWFCLGFVVGMAGWVYVALKARGEGLRLDYMDNYWVGGAACWVLCYFANTNYAYRAVLLILPVSVWLRQAFLKDMPGRTAAACAVVLSLMLFWVRVRHPSMEAISTYNGLRLAAGTLGFENGLALGLTLYLAWAGVRWMISKSFARGDALPRGA